ncbi:hypothetical protein LTR62_005021 [Meristemomyces frigidus]|uniref:Crh-like protein n=1 Tax=Meristemomyces frigidus TaxID=1508187 RepID=A0AAN7TWG4_9PEZI|nr:hypothetical protein LTR62_005021 [Meristemomyces frigidus]
MRFSSSAAAVLAIGASTTLAQTSTTCDPTKKSCPADPGLNSQTYSADFTKGPGANASWSAAQGTTITYDAQGATFSIAAAGQAPTIQTDFYMQFGRVDVKMKAAPGTGIVSSIVFESDDLDEIDWEFLGGNTAQVETNFFGKGNTTTYDRATYVAVTSPQTDFHTYTVDWNSARIEWIIDGVTVRTLAYDDPSTVGGKNYPQTPMRLKLGNWCAGCEGEPAGTVEWSGGNTTFGNDPYVMYVESVTIQNYNPADSYVWSDESGSWQSIQIVGNGQSGSPSGSAASVPVTATNTGYASPTGSSAGPASVNGTTAATGPTSSVTVAGIEQQTVAAVSTTQTGSSYSMNTASASAQNSGVVGASTEVPAAPTAGSGANGTATRSGGTASQTASSGAAMVHAVGMAASLCGIAAAFLLL